MKKLTPVSPDLDALAELVLAKIVQRIAGAAKPATYSTRRGHDIPGMGHEASQAQIKRCPASVRRGRYHVVSVDAYESWERSQLPAAPPASPPPASEPWSPRAALASVGLRVAR